MAADPGRPHLILVGLPGAGKSTIGRRVARRLGRPFLDFDSEIERREGRTVEQIFADSGEPYFRDRELELTRELVATSGMVLAPGGGWLTIPGAADLLRPPALMIYLRVRPAVAIRRLARARRVRPLLVTSDPLARINELLAAREPAYLSADHVIDADLIRTQEVISLIARLADG